jgi:predicted XRE-type DNA-binding protein
LTQQKAAKLLGLDQPKISALMHGNLRGFSTDRLLRLLNALDQDVQIIVRRKSSRRARASVTVVSI